MKVSTTLLIGSCALILGGCVSSAAPAVVSRPAADTHDQSPLDAGGLTGARTGGSSRRIHVDVDRVDLDVVMERIRQDRDPSTKHLAATLAWRDLAARADADGMVALPDFMRWFSLRTGQTILVDSSAAHERVWLHSSVICSISFDDDAVVR